MGNSKNFHKVDNGKKRNATDIHLKVLRSKYATK